ncbi:hypothetical protein [Roseovarius aquimarinus]|uniref:Glycerol-3-phosphate dehydrogenase n=1 Tax=Roseovarius aquimarinus TaxID=1229156 RepID=A0ABW7I8D3_9RHOB
MSDPVTNVEIEDVLSSIRRLVSSDGRPVKAGETPAQPAKPSKPAEPERLVLTPSLRVDDAAKAADADEEDGADSVEAVAGEDLGGDDWSEDDWSNEVDAPDAEAEDMNAAPQDEFDADIAMAEVDAAPAAEDAGDETPRTDPLRQRVAELEEVVARQPDQWEPDGPGGDGNSGSPVSPLPWEDYSPEDESEDEGAPEEVVEDAIREAAQPAVRHAARGAEADRAKARPERDEDDIPANFAAEDGHRFEGAEDDGLHENDFLPGNDEFLDEDALRDLVADIVRQELQGALGERITRNVRKLVRREIHRALTSQDFQ